MYVFFIVILLVNFDSRAKSEEQLDRDLHRPAVASRSAPQDFIPGIRPSESKENLKKFRCHEEFIDFV
jgi:hypothetical protein